jgi:hypothetical protein
MRVLLYKPHGGLDGIMTTLDLHSSWFSVLIIEVIAQHELGQNKIKSTQFGTTEMANKILATIKLDMIA